MTPSDFLQLKDQFVTTKLEEYEHILHNFYSMPLHELQESTLVRKESIYSEQIENKPIDAVINYAEDLNRKVNRMSGLVKVLKEPMVTIKENFDPYLNKMVTNTFLEIKILMPINKESITEVISNEFLYTISKQIAPKNLPYTIIIKDNHINKFLNNKITWDKLIKLTYRKKLKQNLKTNLIKGK